MIVVPCPLTWHSAHITAPDVIRHYITGVAAPPQHVLSGTSMDMPLLRGRSRHFPFLRILPFCVLRRRFAFRRVLLYLSSKTIYENDWERHPQRVLISLLFPIWHTAIVSVIHYHGVHTLSMLLSSTSLVSLCRCPTPYRVSANLQAGLSCTTKIVTLHGKVYRMANWPSTIQVI